MDEQRVPPRIGGTGYEKIRQGQDMPAGPEIGANTGFSVAGSVAGPTLR